MRRNLLPLLLAVALLMPTGAQAAWPGYSKIETTLESQPVERAQLVYFDQSVADALGIKLPPGRVGVPAFEKAVLKKLAYEIKQGSKVISNPASTHDAASNPYFYVENDAFGGSGRAGYIEVDPGAWVNIKGIGITGAGRTNTVAPSPPSDVFYSHHDGSATLEESIKETVMSRVADEELSAGGSRVLAIIYTGRTLRYPDGKEVPLALIVRAPLKRYDQGGDADKAIETLAEANAKRILKGDFVNRSNLGAEGEMVDFGTMTFTEGYAPLVSSQNSRFLFEGERLINNRGLYLKTLGKGLIEQMGIPEAQLARVPGEGAQFEEIGRLFTSAVYWVKGNPDATATPTVLDFQQVPWDKLQGNVKFHVFFRDAAKNYFEADPAQRERIFNQELQRLLSLTGDRDATLEQRLSDFLKQVQDVFEKVAQANSIGEAGSAMSRAVYGEKLGEIAAFKNRDVADLVRPNLFNNAGTLADQFVRDHNANTINMFIESTVLGNRVETEPSSDSGMIASADPKSTKLYIRAYRDEGNFEKLYQFPELRGAGKDESFGFRVSTDGWKSEKDFQARYVDTKVGSYFEIEIPNGSMPVTQAQVELSPFIRKADGEMVWVGDHLNLRGPPMIFNERLGLPASFARQEGVMRGAFEVKTSIHPADITPYGSRCDFQLLGK